MLANRSEELVVAGAETLPRGSAQFDLAGLQPAPQTFLPLRPHVPLAGDGAAERLITTGPEVVEALHDLAGFSQSMLQKCNEERGLHAMAEDAGDNAAALLLAQPSKVRRGSLTPDGRCPLR